MYNFADTSDFPFLSNFYFCVLVTIGSFFTLNLILAQIMDTQIVEESKIRESERRETIRNELI